MKINVSIFGVSGYTGTQLLSILSCHKNVNITGVFGEKSLGKNLNDLFPNMIKKLDLVTVIPPLIRRIGGMADNIYPILSKLNFLNTHYLGLLIKE